AKSDGRDAEAEAVRLASVNHVVALLGGTDSAQAEQLARGAESAGVPVVLQAALPSASPGDNVFACVPSLSRRGQVPARYARRAGLNSKGLGILADERSGGETVVADAFLAELKDGIIRMSFNNIDRLPETVNSITPIKPQAVLFAGSIRDLPRLRTEMKR